MSKPEPTITLGVVSFLNSQPLIEGLDARRGVSLHYAVPSALPPMLRRGEVDAALVPVVDLFRSAGAWDRVSDACIASDGETLTVRVYSKVPPEQISILYVDPDSHTSVALSRLIWTYHFGRRIIQRPLADVEDLNDCEAVLLIGDKVVNAPLRGFEYEIDLGGAWKEWTGLPFVFAVWVRQAQPGLSPSDGELAGLLEGARDAGVARAAEIAEQVGPSRGWPVDLARRYMTDILDYTLTPRHLEGMRQFLELCVEEGITPDVREVVK